MEAAINRKWGQKTIWLAILAGVVLIGYMFANRDGKVEKREGIVLEETPPTVDNGVVSSGFEEAVQLSEVNMQAAVSPYQKIDGTNSLLLDFNGQGKGVCKVKDYIDGVYENDFYRLGFWAKADRDKEIILGAANDQQNQSLRKFLLKGDGEARYYEVVFQAQSDAEDLIISAEDNVASRVWLDNFSIDRLDISSEEELKNMKPTIVGETTWQNTSLFGNDNPTEEATGDFFSRPGAKTGIVFQPAEALISGAMLKIRSHGNGGAGWHQLQIRPFDENLGIISENIIANAYMNHGYSPEQLEEMKKREQGMREEQARKEKAISEGKIADDPTVDYYPSTFTQEDINKMKREKRDRQLVIAIAAMKEEYNLAKEIAVPLSAKLDPQKKYWIGISNEGATVDLYNYLEIYWSSSENGKMSFASDANYNWKQTEKNIWLRLWSPEQTIRDGLKIASGACIVDLGAGRGRFRYSLKNTDGSSFSGFHGRAVNDMQAGNFAYTDVNGYYRLDREDVFEDNFAVYKFSTFYPIEKIILRNILYNQSLLLEISSDGENWEEIVAEEASDPDKPGQISHLVVRGDSESKEFYLRVSPEGNIAMLMNLELEAELRL